MCVCIGACEAYGKKRRLCERIGLKYRALDIHLTPIISSDANLAPANIAVLDHEFALLCAYCWCQTVSGRYETWCRDIHTRDADTH